MESVAQSIEFSASATTVDAERTVRLPDGEAIPALGVGTWHMGERDDLRRHEVGAIRHALDLGVRLIDTAEMYGDGGAERVVGAALAGRRDDVFVVSKIYPHNASRGGTRAACERSLRRLGTDRIDLYLLHWRGAVPLEETVTAFEQLRREGKIRHWGVSNFDLDDMERLWAVPGGSACAVDQVCLSAAERGAEYALLPWLRDRRIPAMAYCPLGQGALAYDRTLESIGRGRGVSAAQVALAWLLAKPGVIAIPKAVERAHLEEVTSSSRLALSTAELATIDSRFPPPRRKVALAIN
ncbi:MAG TPA: aldo/keto reductase [Burkholderiaceae bacterium]|nr:aldo/keto reductase [Burkholderiaceae bacterium]